MAIKIGNFNQKFVLYIVCVCVCICASLFYILNRPTHTKSHKENKQKCLGKIFQLANIHPHNHRKSGLSSLSIKEKSLFIWPQKPSSFPFYSVWFYCNNNNNTSSSITSSSKSYNHGDKDNDQLSLNYAVCCWVCITF